MTAVAFGMHRFLLGFLFSFHLMAADGPPSVAQAVKLFQVEKGAKIEIAATEPQLRD